MHRRTYAGNPNDLYSVDELKDFVDRTKHTVSPAYSPTVARECLHIKCTVGMYAGNPNALYTMPLSEPRRIEVAYLLQWPL